ncbi:MAG: arylesterase [Casimicrobiaceae bacterium]
MTRTLRSCLVAIVAFALAATVVAADKRATILVVGDSISAGYGLPAGTGWAFLLGQRLSAQHYAYDVVNASISGDTTAGGRARLPALLAQYHPAIVVIELGGNDGLRGGDLAATRANLDWMLDAVVKARARPLLIGMQLPPNYGSAYTSQFAALYTGAARRHHVALVPFFFEGFAAQTQLFQADRIHPTVAAQPRLLDNLWPLLQPMLAKPR